MHARSSNPALSDKVFQNFDTYADSSVMTITGTALKTMIAILLAFLTAGWMFLQVKNNVGFNPQPFIWGGAIVGMICAFATMFKPTWAAFTTPVYALAEGLFLGGISAFLDKRYPGIAFQACGLTFGVLIVMLVCYQTGLIKVTQKLRMAVTACTGAIFLVYMLSFVLSFFGITFPLIHSAGPMGICFSLFVVGLASFNLLLDFDLIDRMASQRAPKHMEWYGAFALMITLVWLYMEIIRLLSKLQSRD